MKQVVYKIFTIGQFEKEEKWINEMAAKGLMLKQIGLFRYVFEDGKPGEYCYRLELLDNVPSHPESIAYIRFMEETGVEHIGSWLRWVYFRKKASHGDFDLYSDLESQIKHYKRILSLGNIVAFINLFVALWEFSLGIKNTPFQLSFNSFVHLGIFNFVIAVIILYIITPIRKKIHELKKEKMIRE